MKCSVKIAHRSLLLIAVVAIVFGNACSPTKQKFSSPAPAFDTQLPPALLKRDFALFRQALLEAHGAPYRFISAERMQRALDSVEASLDTAMTVGGFYKKLKFLTALIRDGHTIILPPESYRDYVNNNQYLFPLYLRFIGDQAYVRYNFSDNDTVAIHDEVVAINGMPIENIVDSLSHYVSTSGFGETSLLRNLHYYFAEEFNEVLSIGPSYTVTVKKRGSSTERQFKVNGINQKLDNARYEALIDSGIVTREKLLDHQYIDSLSTMYLQIKSFRSDLVKSRDGIKAKKYLTDVFEEMKDRQAKRLVLDLRNNGGGSETLTKLLFSYLYPENFQATEYVRTHTYGIVLNNGIDPPIKVNPFYHAGFVERVLQYRKDEDGRHYRVNLPFALNLKAFSSSPDYVFDGDVYVIMNGYTFSAASNLAALLYKTDRAIFVGEASGEHFYDGTSVAWLDAKLPHSRIELHIPLFEDKLATEMVSEIPYGHTVPVDHVVPDSLEDIIKDQDTQLDYTLELINTYEAK